MNSLSGALSSAQVADIAAFIAQPTVSGPSNNGATGAGWSLQPGALDFGTVQINTSAVQRQVVLSQSGSSSAAVQASVSGNGYRLVSGCGPTLAAGASCTMTIAFTASAEGTAAGTLNVNAGGQALSVPLNAIGSWSAAPALQWADRSSPHVDFGSTEVGGNPVTQRAQLRNAGPGPTTIKSMDLQGEHAASWTLDAGSTCSSGRALAQDESCSVVLNFKAASVGSSRASLNVNSTGSNPQPLALDGQGEAASGNNVGAGGCSIGRPDEPADPIWWLLGAGSVWALWRRRRDAQARATPENP